MPHLARRSVLLTIASLVTATGVGFAVAPAVAAPVTVQSPIKPRSTAGIDIRSAEVDYDGVGGRLAVTLVMRGQIATGEGLGPNYSVLMYGPRDSTGGTDQSVLSMLSLGYPGVGSLVVNPPGTAVDELVPVDVRYIGDRVLFGATDDRLKNLPLRYLRVQTSLDRIFLADNVATTDTLSGRLPG